MDWASRRVLSWRLSSTLDARFYTDALIEALQRYGRPETFNTDQGSQFSIAADVQSDCRDLLAQLPRGQESAPRRKAVGVASNGLSQVQLPGPDSNQRPIG